MAFLSKQGRCFKCSYWRLHIRIYSSGPRLIFGGSLQCLDGSSILVHILFLACFCLAAASVYFFTIYDRRCGWLSGKGEGSGYRCIQRFSCLEKCHTSAVGNGLPFGTWLVAVQGMDRFTRLGRCA